MKPDKPDKFTPHRLRDMATALERDGWNPDYSEALRDYADLIEAGEEKREAA